MLDVLCCFAHIAIGVIGTLVAVAFFLWVLSIEAKQTIIEARQVELAENWLRNSEAQRGALKETMRAVNSMGEYVIPDKVIKIESGR